MYLYLIEGDFALLRLKPRRANSITQTEKARYYFTAPSQFAKDIPNSHRFDDGQSTQRTERLPSRRYVTVNRDARVPTRLRLLLRDHAPVPYEDGAIFILRKGVDSMADKQSREIGELSVKVNVNVSEALTGLKALQREAKKATQALRELESVINAPLPILPNGVNVNEIVVPLSVGECVTPFTVSSTVPDHVKQYRQNEKTYESSGDNKYGVWFGSERGNADE